MNENTENTENTTDPSEFRKHHEVHVDHVGRFRVVYGPHYAEVEKHGYDLLGGGCWTKVTCDETKMRVWKTLALTLLKPGAM